MPTYQYRCTSCGHDLEAVQKFSDASLTECPNCGGPLRKVFNAVGVVFKGSGFYRTDSRTGKSEDGSGGGSKDGGTDSGKGKDADGEGKKDAGTKESTPAKEAKPAKEPVASGTSSTGGSTKK